MLGGSGGVRPGGDGGRGEAATTAAAHGLQAQSACMRGGVDGSVCGGGTGGTLKAHHSGLSCWHPTRGKGRYFLPSCNIRPVLTRGGYSLWYSRVVGQRRGPGVRIRGGQQRALAWTGADAGEEGGHGASCTSVAPILGAVKVHANLRDPSVTYMGSEREGGEGGKSFDWGPAK